MTNEDKQLRLFGKFRLDVDRKVLWHEQEPVNLPLKEIALLCAVYSLLRALERCFNLPCPHIKPGATGKSSRRPSISY